MTKRIIFILGLLITSVAIAATLLRTDTGFYYPANMLHSNSIYYGFNDRNPNIANGCHLAVDYSKAQGQPIYAVGEGVVDQLGANIPFYGSDDGTGGGAMIIKHTTRDNKTFFALYGHLQNMSVSVGDQVSGGQQIAEIGPYRSGTLSLPHLHFGINTESSSYIGYTSPACVNYLGFVEPENYLQTNLAKLTDAESCNANNDSANTDKNTIVNITSVLSNDTDSNGDSLALLSVESNSINGGNVIDNGDGTLRYTPALNFVGTDQFSYTLTDNNGCSSSALVNITVGDMTEPTTSSSSGGSINLQGLMGLFLLLLVSLSRKKIRNLSI